MEILIGVIGWAGTILLVAAYGLLTAKRIAADGWKYQTMNLIGGVFLLLNCAYYAAWPSAALNLVWFVIGAVGLVQARRAKKTRLRSTRISTGSITGY